MEKSSVENPKSILEMEKIDKLSDLRFLQGKELSTAEAEHLYFLQKTFTQEALDLGFREVAHLKAGEGPSTELGLHIKNIEEYSSRLRNKGMDFEAIKDSLKMLQTIYEKIHNNPKLSDQDKLFLEFYLGLCCVDINIKVALRVAQGMAEKNPEAFKDEKKKVTVLSINNSSGNIIDALETSSSVAKEIGNILQRAYENKAEDFWKECVTIFKENDDLNAVARQVVSMRFIPASEGRDIEGAAQFLHWSGFGGSGDFLKSTPDLNSFDEHAIAWHGGNNEQSHFSQRMKLFREVIIKLKQYEAEVLSELVKEGGEEKIRLLDFGAGPIAKGSHLLAEKLGPGLHIEIDASDVDVKSIASLSRLKSKPARKDLYNTEIRNVLRVDANLPWDGPSNEYDVSITSIVLHQVMDAERGAKIAAQTLQSLTKATKVDGYISWSDAGEHAYIQSPVIPFNVADREGAVPRNIMERVSYHDVAVPSRKKNGTQYFKIPFRLSNLRHATPSSVAEKHGSGIYELNIFKVIEVSEDVLNELDTNRRNPDVCDEIIRRVSEVGKRLLGYSEALRIKMLERLKQ
jgi:hypothetical protein